jgi:Ca2+-transporting ATPase
VSDWYQQSASTVLRQFNSQAESGLTAEIAQQSLKQFGPNTLREAGRKSAWLILWEQISAPLVVMLIIAAIISLAIGDLRDAIAIIAIVIFNAALGLRQEVKAEQALAALKRMVVPTVRVRREGQIQEISAQSLVPGDIVLIEAGNMVPADGRLIETVNLQIQESALTGEAEPVNKKADVILDPEQSLGDRCNMVYRGTTVTRGRGTLVVTETGMETELGRIAQLIQSVETEATPLQKRLDQLGKVLGMVALAIALVIAGLGLLRGEDLQLMLLTAVSVAVAAVPEGLPAVVTIALALGAERMLKRHALIRNLPAVETLGSVTTICSDKTGTLTENRMTVTVLDVAETQIDMRHSNQAQPHPATEQVIADPALTLLLVSGALCNDATLETGDVTRRSPQAIGDPTETALVVAAAQVGLHKTTLEEVFPRLTEIPFDSEHKRMVTCHRCPQEAEQLPKPLRSLWRLTHDQGRSDTVIFCKGAIHSLLEMIDSAWVQNRPEPLSELLQQRIMTAHDQLAQSGLRVLALAFGCQSGEPEQSDLQHQKLTFLGFAGMVDPARPEVKSAIDICQTAGIKVVMITGDHALTAHHIASELGIRQGGKLLTGQELGPMQETTLTTQVEQVDVYARVSPEDKLKIVRALQKKGHIVAMTGDGVNDAPALKQADIGVAMGITGTDVSKEAADIVLQDDNFATIVAAVREGRVIYDNIRKFIKYTLTGNAGQLWLLLLAPFLGMPLPLQPIQILWINLIADGLLALALSFEPAERNVMRRPPYRPNESIFARGIGRDILWVGLLLGVVLVSLAYAYWYQEIASWQTMVFTTLAFSRIALSESIRSQEDSLFKIGLFSNQRLLGAVVLTFLLQVTIIYLPIFQRFFGTVALSVQEIAIAILLSTLCFWALEMKKLLAHKLR